MRYMGDLGCPHLLVVFQVNMHAQSLPLDAIENLCVPEAYYTIRMNKFNGYCISMGETDELMGLFLHVQQRGMEGSETASDIHDIVRVEELHLASGRSPV